MRVFGFSAFWVGEHWKNRMMYIDWRKYITLFLEPKAVLKFYTYLSFLRHGSNNIENLVICPWERLSLTEWAVNHLNRLLLSWAPFFSCSHQDKSINHGDKWSASEFYLSQRHGSSTTREDFI